MNILAIFLLPNALILTVFGVALKSGVRMKASEAFAALQILNMLRDPTRWLPFFIGLMMEFTVSMRRIQNFLQSEEINHLLIENDNSMNSPNALTIKSSNFSWGGEKIDSNEKEAEKVKELKKVQKETHKEIKKREEEELKKTKANKYRINYDFDEESKDMLSDSSPSEDEPSLVVPEIHQDKKEMKVKDIVTLKNITLNIEKGEFICIIGEIGSGKSSLINALMADLIYMSNETVKDLEDKEVDRETLQEIFDKSKKQGVIKFSGSVSYVQQVPWIQNMTLRDNILFGSELDEDKYNRTIEQCQLVQDFAQLEGGDLTEIGEKGINLSGGQKARVSLARAVYANKDIILMDDPISALDANTKERIFEEVFEGELKRKTRILVTHAVDFLERFDRIAIMAHGKIKYIGTYEELRDKDEIQHINETLKHVSEKEQEEEEHEIKEIEIKRKTSNDGPNSSNNYDENPEDSNTDNKLRNARKMSYMSVKSLTITTDEYDEKVEVEWSVYFKFFISNYTWIAIVIAVPLYTFYGYAGIQATKYIGIWVKNVDDEGSFERYLWIVLGYSLGFSFTVTIGFFIIMVAVLRASNLLHKRMTDKTLRAPINLYFDKTPTGKILNRFSKDINKIDSGFPFDITFTIECLSWIGASVYVSALVSPWSLLATPFAAIAGVILIRYYIRSFREMIRIENVTNSPILSNFAETISGATTIRCFKRQQDFILKNYKLIDDNLNAFFWLQSLNIWFSLRLQYISSFMMIVSLAFCIIFKYSADVSTVGTLLIYLMVLQGNILWFFRTASAVEGGMVSYDRCNQILSIPQEQFNTHPKPPANWPSEGRISFQNLNLRYRPETELVLNNLSFEIEPKQKIGVVGRTGAGKSTVCLALCRIVEADSGDIVIDGIPIKSVDIATVREKITIIPQDPTLFEGSLRFNLDPESRCSESEIVRLVRKAMLQDLWDSNKEIAQNGENLSSGQKQLICICRAILRKNKIILMDEATANIDINTEEIIQKLITEEFIESTVITIAHRLNTIQSSDKVIILEKGEVVQKDIKDFREYFA